MDWQLGAAGGKTYWDAADEFIAAKQAGRVDRKNCCCMSSIASIRLRTDVHRAHVLREGGQQRLESEYVNNCARIRVRERTCRVPPCVFQTFG
jgi:hypothetical protein